MGKMTKGLCKVQVKFNKNNWNFALCELCIHKNKKGGDKWCQNLFDMNTIVPSASAAFAHSLEKISKRK